MNSPPPDQRRHPIESIASDVAESMRRGRRSSIDPIVEANPDLESELRDLLPVIQRLEKARQSHGERPGGFATLGASRPTHLGDYELVRQIGRGGMGVVFEAVQKSLGRKVAVKVLPKSLLADDLQLKRFEQEARTAGSLHHTNIVPVFGVGDDQGFHYYVMQRIDGQGLDRAISDGRILRPDQVAKLGQQAASALAYAHQHNVLHRDIKPANLIVNDEDQLWVTDFGVSKAIESEAVTRTGDVMGTLRYMAPEQIVGVTDFRSDIYSLGVTLYEILAGRPAMDDASIRQAIVARRPAPAPPPLRQLNPAVPRDLETILQTAMSADVNDRYASAHALADDLQRFLDGEPIAVRRMSPVELAVRWARRNPAVASLSALSLALLLGVAVLSTISYFKVQSALKRTEEARTEAETNAKLASGALNQVFNRFAVSLDDNTSTAAQFSSPPTLSSEVADLLEDLLAYYDRLAVRGESDPRLRLSAANAKFAMGDIHYQLGHYRRCIESFTLAMNVDGQEEIAADRSDRLREARIRNRIGLAHRMLGEHDQANEQHEKAHRLLFEIAGVSDREADNFRYELAHTHYLRAARLRPGMGPNELPPAFAANAPMTRRRSGPRPRDLRRGESSRPHAGPARPTTEQLAHLNAAVDILSELHADHPQHDGYTLALAASLRQLVGDSLNDLTESEVRIANQAINLLRQLHGKRPADANVRSELAAALAEFTVFEDNWSFPLIEKAVERLREAASHCEALSLQHPNVPIFTNRLVHTHYKLGIMLQRFAELEAPGTNEVLQEAGVSFRKASQRYRDVTLQYPEAPGYRAWYALILQRQAENAMMTHLMEQAERTFLRSARAWKWVAEHYPDEEVSWVALPRVYRQLSHTQYQLYKDEAAEESMLEADLWALKIAE